jgi:hypothetical protein
LEKGPGLVAYNHGVVGIGGCRVGMHLCSWKQNKNMVIAQQGFSKTIMVFVKYSFMQLGFTMKCEPNTQ